jgi:hypothetical protein
MVEVRSDHGEAAKLAARMADRRRHVAERDSDPAPAPDPVGDFQRWLMRAGARSVSREVSGRVRRTLGGEGSDRDVWDKATSEPESGEHLQCFPWCPICSAARLARDSGPGAPIAAVGDTLSSVVQGAFGAFEAVVKATEPPETIEPPKTKPPGKVTAAKSVERSTAGDTEPSVESSVEPSVEPSAEGGAEPSVEPSAEGGAEPSAEGSAESAEGSAESAEEARGAAHEPDDRG